MNPIIQLAIAAEMAKAEKMKKEAARIPVAVYPTPEKRLTVVKFADGSVHKATCNEDETYDTYTGMCVAIAKHLVGKKNLDALMEKVESKTQPTKEDEVVEEKKITRQHVKPSGALYAQMISLTDDEIAETYTVNAIKAAKAYLYQVMKDQDDPDGALAKQYNKLRRALARK